MLQRVLMMLPGRKGWEKLDWEFNNSQNKKFVFPRCSLPFKCVIQAPRQMLFELCWLEREQRMKIDYFAPLQPRKRNRNFLYAISSCYIFVSSHHESCENLTWISFPFSISLQVRSGCNWILCYGQDTQRQSERARSDINWCSRKLKLTQCSK